MTQQTRTRAALKKFLATEEELQPVDRRSSELEEQIVIDPAVLEALREVFSGTNVIEDESKIRRILDVRAEILRSWSEARDSFISIGRALISLEETLSKTEFQRLRSGSERVFPFSEATATQFRQIARAVDNGRLPYEACPGSYGTAYQITLLDDEQLAMARDRGLLRADVTRREITLLRQETRGKSVIPGRVDKSLLQEERKRLKRREQQISEELDTILRRLKELSRLLDRGDDEDIE
ncbi:MAG: hypothetical protein ACRYFY_10700 [Janthinobacterium lividum]